MKKSVKITILVVTILLIILCLGLGFSNNLFRSLKNTFIKETLEIDEINKIDIMYKENNEQSINIECTDKEILNTITAKMLNQKLQNYTGKITTGIVGKYTVILDDNINFRFDEYDPEGVIIVQKDNKSFVTKISPRIMRLIIEYVEKI